MPLPFCAYLHPILSSTVSKITRIIGPVFSVDGRGCLSITHSFGVTPKFRIAKFGLNFKKLDCRDIVLWHSVKHFDIQKGLGVTH